MYVILVNDDNTMLATKKQRIVQRSKLVDDLWFLVKPTYNGHDMSMFTVSLEYVSPISKKYQHEILTLSQEKYNDYLKYVLPIDTKLTAEAGDIALQLTFLYVGFDENGESEQRVRKVNGTGIKVFPVEAWSDIIPDSALSALDQRIIKTDAQIKALSELTINSVDGLDYDDNRNEIQLKAGEKLIGNRVAIAGGQASLEDGIPVVDFSEITEIPSLPKDEEEDDDVVDF